MINNRGNLKKISIGSENMETRRVSMFFRHDFSSREKSGFTLIELVVVVGIIALLTSVILSSLGKAKQGGNDAGKIRALQEVRSALQLYFTDNGSYPGGIDLSILTAGSKKYIASIDQNIKYQGTDATNISTCASNCSSYHLGIALLQNGNGVLKIDKDLDMGFNGKNDLCAVGGSDNLSPDKCYDVTP